jgi:putative ABC transport system permease protein
LRAQTGAPTMYTVAGRATRAWTVFASPTVIDVLGLSFIEGGLPDRKGTTEDGIDSLVISKDLRDHLFAPGDTALGRVVRADDARPGRIVGVVKTFLLREPFWDNASSVALRLTAPVDTDAWTFLVRAHPGQRAKVADAVRQFAGVDGPTRWISVTSYGVGAPRFQSVADGLVLLFINVGATIAIIALVGALAVSSFVVAARRREIGIRRALGATRANILRYFLVDSTLAAGLGTSIGLVVTLALLLAMREALGNVPIGVWQLAVAAVFMWANATAAALLPARHAARLPPTLATRAG